MKNYRNWIVVSAVLLIALVLSLILPLALAEDNFGYLDNKPRVAIMSAFGAELQLLLDQTTDKTEYVENGRTFTTGELRGVDVVLTLSGVSMVNAAANTQLLIDHFNVIDLIFSGIAGGVNPDLRIGDVVVPAQWAQYQEMIFAREVDGEYILPWGGVPEFPNFGMMFPSSVSVTKNGGTPNEEESMFWFAVDPTLLGYARSIPENILEKCTPEDVCLEQQPIIKVGGNGVDGQTFVDNAEFRDYVWKTFEADSLSMETAAVAQVTYMNAVPFLGFRSLSDLAGGGDGENEIGIFFQLAANNSANVVMAFLDNYRTGQAK
ncbi:5'-methylthioadenosine/S-adenosylhomocysteine nucleosidase [Patescibacteria group bacterium]|nr:5'-methylthioadenosine/S-adenosylhomocysteine nucleosidase [Patescibacteria group bacterium]